MSKKIRHLVFGLSLFISSILYAQTGGIPTGTDTTCLNGISFYQKYYGGTKNDFGLSVASSSDSGNVIAGHTNSFGNGGYDGLLMKVDKKGNMVWSKALGGSGDDAFYTVRRATDNGFIAVGQTKSYGNPAGDAWLVKLDVSGNVQWSKKYGDGNVNGEIAYDVVQLSDGGYAFSGSHRFAPGTAEGFVTRTDNQGNVIWSKQYGVSGSDQIAGLVEDGNFLVVVGFYQGGSFYDSYIMKLDKSNGAVQWIRGYDAENRSNWFTRINKTNNGYQVLSTITDNFADQNQQACIWNLDVNGNMQNVRKLVIPSTWTLSYGWHSLADGGFVAVNSENNAGADLIICRVNANGTLDWSKKFVRNGKQQIAGLTVSPEGGYAGVGYNNNPGTIADSNNVYIIRVDSLGDAGTCSGINTSELTVVIPSSSTTTPGITDLGNVVITNPVITTSVVNFVPVTTTGCYNCKPIVPIIPTDTTCLNGISFYQKYYGGTKNDFGLSVASSSDSGNVIAGHTNSFGNGGYDGLLMKVDKKGNMVWSKALGGSGDDAFYTVRRTTDNGFIAVGQTKSYGNPAGDAWLVKLDVSGNVQWSKKYGDGNVNGEIAYDVVQLSDGGYAFSGSHRFAPGTAEGFVTRTDNQGNVIWSKQYGVSGSDQIAGLVEDGNFLVVVGFYQGGSFYDSYIMKLDKSNGAVQWIRGYDAENRSNWFTRINKTNNGYQVLSTITDNFADQNQQACIWNLDVNGNMQNVRKLVIPSTWTLSYGWHSLADGGFVAVNSENNAGADLIMCRVNANGTLDWSKKFVRNGKQQIAGLTVSPEGGYAGVGYNNNPGTIADSNNVYIIRVDSLGDAGTCSGINTSELTVVIPSSSTTTPGITDLGNVVITNPVITTSVVNFVPVTTVLCFYCQPKPTGSARAATPVMQTPHILKVYPNPVPGGTINLLIQAEYNDKAIISLVDLSGNLISILGSKDINKGDNLFPLNLPNRLQAYSNYYIRVKYREFTSSAQILIVN